MAGALMAGASIPTLEPESGQRRRYTRMVRGKFTDSLPRTQRLASCACLKRPREATSPSSNRASADSRIALCRAGTGSAPTLPTRFRAAPLPAESADLFPADTTSVYFGAYVLTWPFFPRDPLIFLGMIFGVVVTAASLFGALIPFVVATVVVNPASRWRRWAGYVD